MNMEDVSKVHSVVNIQILGLSRPVTSLAESITRAASLLWTLHIGLYDFYGESSSSVIEFTEAKQNMGMKWERLRSFLQRSFGYTLHYMTLCHSLKSGGLIQHAPLAAAIISNAHQIRNEIVGLIPMYMSALQQFSLLTCEDRTQKYQPGPSIDLGIYTPNGQTLCSVFEALQTTLITLQESAVHIGDISAFWDEYVSHLAGIFRSGEVVKKLGQNGYFQREIITWKSYHDPLLQAIFSIASSCDPPTVAPINQTNWRKRFARVRPARRITGRDMYFGPELARRQNSGFRALTSPMQYDVLEIKQATLTVHTCFQICIARARSSIAVDIHAALERPLQEIDKYIMTLASVEGIAIAGIKFCRDAQILSREQNNMQASSSMREQALNVSSCIHEVLDRYKVIDIALRQGVKYVPAKKYIETQLPYSKEWNQAVITNKVKVLHDMELLTYTEIMFGYLIQLLMEFRSFWLDVAAYAEYLCTHGPVSPLSDQELYEEWKRQLCDYQSEILKGKLLRQTKGKTAIMTLATPLQYEILSLNQATSILRSCIQVIFTRAKSKRLSNRLQAYKRLFEHADEYTEILTRVEGAIITGILFCRNAQRLFPNQDDTLAFSLMYDQAQSTCTRLRQVLHDYDAIYRALLQELYCNKAATHHQMKRPALSQSEKGPIHTKLSTFKCRRLLSHTESILQRLIQGLKIFHIFWSDLLVDIERISKCGLNGSLKNSRDLCGEWKRVEEALREYQNEVTMGRLMMCEGWVGYSIRTFGLQT